MTGKTFSSVWLREPRKATSPGRSREEIVRAAVELLNEEGLSGLSMRKLGAKLSAGATSLYWYVANKDELLELVYDEVWGEMMVPDPDEVGWREAVSVLAHSMRQVILSHPWSAELIGRLPALGPNALHVANEMRGMFKQAGFTGADTDYAIATLTAFIFGMTIPEIAWNAKSGAAQLDVEQMRSMVVQVFERYPHMREGYELSRVEDPRVVREVAFDFGLVSVLDGLERRLPT
ncbi:TetR/AcrR family transcriptional regulator [Nonomuraea gerenzanensis]|uniref:Transcriptional regulator, TetR family n=1 Tax=Nonomuraea gerenzanensis TaxID=93944 RepID=A0A1M4E2U9_9ACTN|nr:TetR/AcrR family transcriptional regulator [Nonomuraea gerenzanensis]UBU15409.1 TetR/AcrR family transcriptional regulator [Nonomuraea gerenzanensis]SBO93165.1 Transcriptional regulator, TetR family [Nonomuraea gerenzanensis]